MGQKDTMLPLDRRMTLREHPGSIRNLAGYGGYCAPDVSVPGRGLNPVDDKLSTTWENLAVDVVQITHAQEVFTKWPLGAVVAAFVVLSPDLG